MMVVQEWPVAAGPRYVADEAGIALCPPCAARICPTGCTDKNCQCSCQALSEIHSPRISCPQEVEKEPAAYASNPSGYPQEIHTL